MSFENLGLSAELLRAISEQGYTQATPIQTQAIPPILDGKDVLAGAQTGTGKTAGFTLPLLQRLTTKPRQGKPRQRSVCALVLTPTRELALQVADSVERYSRYLPIRSAAVFGGVKINPQINRLRKGIDVLTATPGRLLDHARQKTIDLSQVEILVLDEADRMLDMGFIHDIKKIIGLLPETRQTLLFSATFSTEIRQLSNKFLKRPVSIEVARRNTAAKHINQLVHPVDRKNKPSLLSYMIDSQNMHQVLIFTRTKHMANRMASHLEKDGIHAAAIHGNKSQGARTKALADFKAGKVRALVATDIAARGLDIAQLPHVINYELPDVAQDYVHRIGRTGRAGHNGEARSLVCVDEHKLLKSIEGLIKLDIPKDVIPGFEPDPNIKAEPVRKAPKHNNAPPKPGKRKKAFKSGAKAQRTSRTNPPRNKRRGNQMSCPT